MFPLLFNLRILRVATLALLLLGAGRTVAQTPADSKPILYFNSSAEKNVPAAPPSTIRQDRNLAPAGFDATPNESKAKPAIPAQTMPADSRRLAPQSNSQFGQNPNIPAAPDRSISGAIPKIESLTTAGTGLAIVLGLFIVCMWLMRRSGPKPTTPLPKEAVAVLGRVPLAARNFAHLLQIGNKLVLVAVTPEGVAPITEVTDPTEVDRLLGICLRNHKHSTTAEFKHVLEQLANEPAKGFLGKEAQAMSAGLRR